MTGMQTTASRQKEPTTKPLSVKQVLSVDNHPIFRMGMAVIINAEIDLQVCGEADGADRS